jgi:3-oxoacyl-[acyl-carrier protein] reductase
MTTTLITGATGGFGPVLAKHLSSKGHRLLLHGRNSCKLQKLCSTLEDHKHLTFTANPIISKDAASEMCGFILAQNALPNIIVHHLGGTQGVKSALASVEQWLSVLTLNTFFAAEINRLLMPHFLKIKLPVRIIHISSISALSLRGSAPYACSKAMLNAYVVCLAREVATSNVSISAIMPGAFHTPGSNWETYMQTNPSLVKDFLRHHHASNRLGEPTEILPAIDFLSDFSNTFAQGCIINIDGGTM